MKRLFCLLALTMVLATGIAQGQLSTNLNTTTPPSITSGLVGLWHLNTNFVDSSGYAHHGTLTGTATPTVGRFNYGYHLDGSSFIDVGNINVNTSNAFTVSAWVKSTSAYVSNDFRMVVADVGGTSVGGPFELYVGDGQNTSTGGTAGCFNSYNGGTTAYNLMSSYSSVKNIRDGNWHHLALTFKPGSEVVYFDGINVKSSTSTTPLPLAYANVRIGGTFFGSFHHPWNGDIDEVSMYSRALSSTEIRTLANAPKLSTSPASSVIVNVQNYDLTFVVENLFQANQAISSKVIKVDGVDRTTEFLSGATEGNITYGKYILIGSPTLTAGTHTVAATFKLKNGDSLTSTVTYRVLSSQ